MKKNLLKRIFLSLAENFWKKTPLQPVISDGSTLSEVLFHYPAFEKFLHDRFNVQINASDPAACFTAFAKSHALPPPQILFMEFQLQSRTSITPISAPKLKKWMQEEPKLVILDVRETWEHNHGSIPGSVPFNRALLEEALNSWPRNQPLAVYCHFGIRSLDAAAFLIDHGFQDVRPLEGGVEAWSEQVDPSLGKYEGEACN